jgi:dienelactone hydrolase
MDLLSSWQREAFTADGITHDVYSKGTGPGVVVIHEIPGMTPKVIEFAEEVVGRGFRVAMPHLFGPAGESGSMLGTIARLCVNNEFTKLALNRTSPVTIWLRALTRSLHEECGGPGVGAIGMCFTGGYALAMLADSPVTAPVLSQPAAPFALAKSRGRDLGMSEADWERAKAKVDGGCQVLGLRYRDDSSIGGRFDRLREELGDNFIAVEFDGPGHSVLTEHRQQEGVDRVLGFLDDKLH